MISAALWAFNLNGIPFEDENIMLLTNLLGFEMNISFSAKLLK
jgi:hypothetical protein